WVGTSPPLGWTNRDTSLTWATPGATGSGSDVLAAPTFTIGGFSGTGLEPKTVALDSSVVQGWVDNPATNQGILLTNDTVNAVTRIHSSEDSNASWRPTLTVTYTTSAPSCVSASTGEWKNTSFS